MVSRLFISGAITLLILGTAQAAPPDVTDILTLRDIGGYQSGLRSLRAVKPWRCSRATSYWTRTATDTHCR
jgi:hypothetical protein